MRKPCKILKDCAESFLYCIELHLYRVCLVFDDAFHMLPDSQDYFATHDVLQHESMWSFFGSMLVYVNM